MSPIWMIVTSASAVVICGLVAGVFLAFSDFVMKSFSASTPVAGMECMQVINRKVYRSLFLPMLLGMAAASLALIAFGLLNPQVSGSSWIISAGMTYIIGVFIVTMVFNVPMNNRLETLEPNTKQASIYWPEYTRNWTRWNLVRTLASTAAMILFLIATIQLAAN